MAFLPVFILAEIIRVQISCQEQKLDGVHLYGLVFILSKHGIMDTGILIFKVPIILSSTFIPSQSSTINMASCEIAL